MGTCGEFLAVGMIERTYLHRPITPVGDLDPDSLPANVKLYRFSLSSDESARLIVVFVKRIIEWREVVFRWHWKITTVESFAKIAFVAADRLGDSD